MLLLLQAGRISAYTLAGGAVAGLSSLAVDASSATVSFKVLQYLGAAALIWIGLATAGMLPRLPVPASGAFSAVSLLAPVTGRLRRHPRLGPAALGLTWALTPCPMVYAALFTAALTGSAAGGALWMLAFGLGTLPGVVASVLGVSALSRMRRGAPAELAAGLLIAGLGFATLYLGQPGGILCLTN
jgi:hypothetical protein